MTPIAGPVTGFDAGDVVRVPFPYVERPVQRHRPALVVSRGGLGPDNGLLWVLMITSAENRRRPGDVFVPDSCKGAGLPVPSLVRTAKIATIDAACASIVGRLPPSLLDEVRSRVAEVLAED